MRKTTSCIATRPSPRSACEVSISMHDQSLIKLNQFLASYCHNNMHVTSKSALIQAPSLLIRGNCNYIILVIDKPIKFTNFVVYLR